MSRFFLLLILFLGAGFYLEQKTKGFRLAQITSTLAPDPQWNIPKPADEEQIAVHTRLQQPFFYLGAGEQSVAFVGQDKKTVLKFFKHAQTWTDWSHLIPLPPSLAKKREALKFLRQINPTPVFRSCLIAYQDLKEESGIVYLQLNRQENNLGTVTVYDPLNIQHEIKLSETEFVVQEFGELLFETVDRQMKKGEIEKAKASICTLLDGIENYCKKGIQIAHPAFRRNVGFADGKMLLLDIGSFRKEEAFKSTFFLRKEMCRVTHKFQRWLRRHHPTLFVYFIEKLEEKLSTVSG